jgi:hypothetical protein
MNAATALTMENRRKIANIAVALSPAVKWLFCWSSPLRRRQP